MKKGVIIGIIIGILVSGITAYAAANLLAANISYTINKNSSVKNVEDALNDLYNQEKFIKIKPIIKDAIMNQYTIDTGLQNSNNIKKLQYFVNDKLVYEGKDLSYTVKNAVQGQEYKVYVKVFEYDNNEDVVSNVVTANRTDDYALLTDAGTVQALTYKNDAMSDASCDGNPKTYETYNNTKRIIKVSPTAYGKTFSITYARQTVDDHTKVYFLNQNGEKIVGSNLNSVVFDGSGILQKEITVPDGANEMVFDMLWTIVYSINKV